jgi:hypothetical protein
MLKVGFLISFLVLMMISGADFSLRGTLVPLVKEIADSGRCTDLSQDPDSRVSPPPRIAPGPPPAVSFRYYEGKLHHRFENADLMLDDAGH